MSTVQKLVLKPAYRLLLGETEPTNEDLSNGLDALNSLISEWSTHRWGTFKVTEEALTLTASDGDYSIGSGADLDTERPIRALAGTFVRISETDYPVKIISRFEYNDLAFKTLTGIPRYLYYEQTYPNGTLKVYPEPDSAYVLYLNSQKALSTYAAFTTSLNLPPEYQTALKFNLAVDWAPELSVQPAPSVVARARSSMKNMKALHMQPVPGIDARPLHKAGRDYDITGDVHY
jgi:hypothetical protein